MEDVVDRHTEAPPAQAEADASCFVRNGVKRCHPKATHQATTTYDVHAIFQNRSA